MEDSGLYSCDAIDSSSLIRSDRLLEFCCKWSCDIGHHIALFTSQHIILLTLALPNIISTAMDPTNPVAGDTLRLECVVTGVPLPVVTWTKDSLSLTSSMNINLVFNPGGRAVLIINSVSVEDSGVYICNATNIASNVFQIFNVQIGGKDTIYSIYTP